MVRRISRRAFLRDAALGGAGLVVLRNARSARGAAANSRLNIALIGAGGRGSWFVRTIPKMENLVALCDANEQRAVAWIKRDKQWSRKYPDIKTFLDPSYLPGVRKFRDFRKMLDELGKGIDAVIVCTPDHTHAVAAAAAIKAGKHVYCEKPLTRTVHESRALRELARKHKVATAMGNQGTASGQFRRAVELIRDGTIGAIKEVHVWNCGGGANRPQPPKGSQPVPDYLKWDLWLGPCAERPFHSQWLRWHAWRDFGTGQLGNWGSHSANLAFMALKVHELWLADPARKPRPRIRIEAKTSNLNRVSFPKWEFIRYEVPARAEFPPITITWRNGRGIPGSRDLLEKFAGMELDWGDKGEKRWRHHGGAVIVGTKGTIRATEHNTTFSLVPADQFRNVKKDRPEKLDPSRGHERDWLIACRGGRPAWSNFDYADALNEFLQLGNVATQFKGVLEFDPLGCEIVNNAAANRALRCVYRRGWSL